MKLSLKEKFGAFGAITLLALIVGGIYGWIANIVKLIGLLDGGLTAMFVARCVGVFFAPLGSVLGFF